MAHLLNKNSTQHTRLGVHIWIVPSNTTFYKYLAFKEELTHAPIIIVNNMKFMDQIKN